MVKTRLLNFGSDRYCNNDETLRKIWSRGEVKSKFIVSLCTCKIKMSYNKLFWQSIVILGFLILRVTLLYTIWGLYMQGEYLRKKIAYF